MAKKTKTDKSADPEATQDDVVTPPLGTVLPSPQEEHAPVPAAAVAAIVDNIHVHETPAAPLFAVDDAEPPPVVAPPQAPAPIVAPVLSEAEQIAAYGCVLG